jgi:hypothetical protein
VPTARSDPVVPEITILPALPPLPEVPALPPFAAAEFVPPAAPPPEVCDPEDDCNVPPRPPLALIIDDAVVKSVNWQFIFPIFWQIVLQSLKNYFANRYWMGTVPVFMSSRLSHELSSLFIPSLT